MYGNYVDVGLYAQWSASFAGLFDAEIRIVCRHNTGGSQLRRRLVIADDGPNKPIHCYLLRPVPLKSMS